jgi:outer membrane protein TolC
MNKTPSSRNRGSFCSWINASLLVTLPFINDSSDTQQSYSSRHTAVSEDGFIYEGQNLAKRIFIHIVFLLTLITSLTIHSAFAETIDDLPLSMIQAIDLAQKNDPWLKGNEFNQTKVESMAISAGQLPDPLVSVGLANIATNSFDFGQEPMTQMKVGISQMIPRGESLSLSTDRFNTLSKQFPHQREDRKAQLAVKVSELWLSAYQEQESIRLIENDRSLFEHLVDVAEASYSSGTGKTRQQDLIRAQLEITRLEDRLTMLSQNLEGHVNQLGEFISNYFVNIYSDVGSTKNVSEVSLSNRLPHVELLNKDVLESSPNNSSEYLLKKFAGHPSVKALNQRILAEEFGVKLAEQKYKPAWGLNASYGYRANAENNMSRADLFSIGISFDLPIFTKNRQDQDLKAAVSSLDAIETEKWLLLRKLMSSYETEKTQLIRLNQRKKLYTEQLLPQMSAQAEASLTAYTNDDGDFAEVVRARIAELNAHIDALKIDVSIQKTIIKLNYLFMDDASLIASSVLEKKND